jgi:hypothetical protein
VLAENELSEVSEQIGRLKRLRVLDLGHNELIWVPDGLADLVTHPNATAHTMLQR